jgi:lipopolysaccharide/colanic/teichoic acid biosynthesis glycosyltransferase
MRLIDILFSGVLIIVLSPVFFIVIIILRFSGEGEVFYLQKRVGKNGKDFFVYKFATMVKNSPNIGSGIYTAKGDPRILPVGHILRKTKINELPQLFNVFLGSMSLVGPRPLIKKTFDLYSFTSQEIITSVKPGLTGVGSIIFRDEESLLQLVSTVDIEKLYKSEISPRKEKVEVWYVKNRNIRLNILLILLTIWVVLFPNSGVVRWLNNKIENK